MTTGPVPSAPSPDRSSGSDVIARVERRALLLGGIAAAAALVLPGGGVELAAAIGGGALLALTSFWALKRGVSGVTDAALEAVRRREQAAGAEPPDGDTGEVAGPATAARRRGRLPKGLLPFVLRSALLAGIAYVMIARLRLPPLGLLGGASVTFLATAAELLRGTRRT